MSNTWAVYRRWIGASNGPLPVSRSALLDAYERRHGWRLPRSYRHFALAFGRAYLNRGGSVFDGSAGEYVFGAPTSARPDLFPDNLQTLAAYDQWQAKARARGTHDPDSALFARLVLFCRYIGNGFYAFDPTDVTDPASRDVRIYRVDCQGTPADPARRRFEPFATTFAGFVLRHVFADEFRWGDPRTGPPPQSVGRDGQPGDVYLSFRSAEGMQ